MRLAARAGVRWRRSWRRGTTRLLALDIGSHSVKLVAARHCAARVQIDDVALSELAPDAMHGHVVRHPAQVAGAVRRLLGIVGRRGRRVVTAVPAPAVMMRRLVVRAGPGESLDAVLIRELATLVPGALDQAVLDYQRIGPDAPDGTVAVLAVAARRDLVQSYTTALRAAGLEPDLVDVDVFALDRLRRAAGAIPRDGSPVALVHVGARYAALTVVRGGDAPAFVGDVPAGSDVDPGSLARGIGCALELGGVEPAPVLALLSGGRAAAAGIAEAIGARLGCAARVLDPFAHVALGARVRRAPLGPGGAAFAVAVGLALRSPEERA